MKRNISLVSMLCVFAAATAMAQSPECTKSKSGCDHKAKAVAAKKDGCCAHAKAVAAKSEDGKNCDAKAVAAKGECSKSDCASMLAAHMPKVQYKVGDKTLCCDKMAGELAKKSGAPMYFVVAGKEFREESKAMEAFAVALDEFLADMTTVKNGSECSASKAKAVAAKGECSKTCDKDKSAKAVAAKSECSKTCDKDKSAKVVAAKGECSKTCDKDKSAKAVAAKSECSKECSEKCDKAEGAQFRVAMFTYDCPKKAEAVANVAKAAAEKVSMKMVVDGKEYCCPMTAGKVAKKSGKQVEFVVGDTKTHCKTTAHIALTKAKIQAAANALMEVNQEDVASAEETEDSEA